MGKVKKDIPSYADDLGKTATTTLSRIDPNQWHLWCRLQIPARIPSKEHLPTDEIPDTLHDPLIVDNTHSEVDITTDSTVTVPHAKKKSAKH
ncbi:hypothetical protein Bca4012_002846 [Brassica carinata]|uniref:Uncharacterized protein n=3 Tax=Brassica TaxID=3705 RepID=A0ABQ7BZN5_BRACR|nr:hypothetical protein DY000_02002724 [Brassica cretica]KAG2295735.1 hypothetical protein Bca52824_042404 [Brassica carinata]VDC90826.1 unnamed protein product [Brassica oleracea]